MICPYCNGEPGEFWEGGCYCCTTGEVPFWIGAGIKTGMAIEWLGSSIMQWFTNRQWKREKPA